MSRGGLGLKASDGTITAAAPDQMSGWILFARPS